MVIAATAKVGSIVSNFWNTIGKTGQLSVKVGAGAAVAGTGIGVGLGSVNESFQSITAPLEKATGIKGISTILIFAVIGIIGLFFVRKAF